MRTQLLGIGLVLTLAACRSTTTLVQPTATNSAAPTAIPCELVGDLPCQVPPVLPTQPVVDAPLPVPPQSAPLPTPTPPPAPSCAVHVGRPTFDPNSSLGQQYVWLTVCRGLRADSYAAWLVWRCQHPGEAAQQDAQYASRCSSTC